MGILSDSTKNLIKDAFEAADTDKSGSIDAGEIEAVLTKMAAEDPEGGFEVPPKEEIEKRLDALPTAEKGKLTLPELIYAVAFMKVMAIVVILFKEADADGSGELEAPEIKTVATNVATKLGENPPTEEELNTLVESAGGKITFDQFAELVIPVILIAFGVSSA